MELTHDFVVPASPEVTWETFMDLQRVGGCFPGATVTEVTDDGFAGTVKVKLGPIALQYTGTGQFVEKDDTAHRAVLEAKGKDKRGNGTAGAQVTIQLEAAEGGTRCVVSTDLAVTGKPAQFGRGVMQDVSDKLLHQFVACIEGELGHAQDGDAGPAAAPAVAGDVGSAAAVADAGSSAEPDDASRNADSDAQVPAESQSTPVAPTPPQARAAAPRPGPSSAGGDDAIDLGSTVLPVLARTYGPYVAVGVVAFLLGWLIGRR